MLNLKSNQNEHKPIHSHQMTHLDPTKSKLKHWIDDAFASGKAKETITGQGASNLPEIQRLLVSIMP